MGFVSTSIVLLAYKEAENLKILLPKIHAVMETLGAPYEILVIDSAQPLDDTEAMCTANHARYIPQEEPFYGGAFRTGIQYAQYDRIQVLDADCSHDPAAMPAIQKKFDEGYDLVIGSRYVKGGVTHDAKSSQLMSALLNTVMRLCVGVKARDISTSYRLYDAALLKSVTLARNNYDVLQEVILRMKLARPSFSIGEVPITFNKRAFGESKRQLFKFIRGYLITVCMLLTLRVKSQFSHKEQQTATR